MRFLISFVLAFATVSLAVPSQTIREKATLHTGHLPTTNGLTRGKLALPSRVRQSGDDVPENVPVIDDITDHGTTKQILPNSESSLGEGSESDSVSGDSLTGDPCQASSDCAGSRICMDLPNLQLCDGGDECRCIPPGSLETCEEESDCDAGEGCFAFDEIQDVLEDITGVDFPILPDNLEGPSMCISKAAREDTVCIASHSLGHISREELVFEKDTIAHVLCDLNGSCATPGHMVRYKGRGMMMMSYCQLTSCVRKVMKVNSPRYRRGLTVPSNSDDLVFTALAARFQSRAEEGVLSVAVRIGL